MASRTARSEASCTTKSLMPSDLPTHATCSTPAAASAALPGSVRERRERAGACGSVREIAGECGRVREQGGPAGEKKRVWAGAASALEPLKLWTL